MSVPINAAIFDSLPNSLVFYCFTFPPSPYYLYSLYLSHSLSLEYYRFFHPFFCFLFFSLTFPVLSYSLYISNFFSDWLHSTGFFFLYISLFIHLPTSIISSLFLSLSPFLFLSLYFAFSTLALLLSNFYWYLHSLFLIHTSVFPSPYTHTLFSTFISLVHSLFCHPPLSLYLFMSSSHLSLRRASGLSFLEISWHKKDFSFRLSFSRLKSYSVFVFLDFSSITYSRRFPML